MAGYGVRKKCPRYSNGRFLLSINDAINAIVCRSEGDNDSVPDDETFQRFGVTEDGIDLCYDADDSTVQISLRYRKLIVTNNSLQLLACARVASSKPDQVGNLLRLLREHFTKFSTIIASSCESSLFSICTRCRFPC